MILNQQANQLMMTDTIQYKNLQDMVLAVINMIIKEENDRSQAGFVFTNFPNVNMHVLDWALHEVGYKLRRKTHTLACGMKAAFLMQNYISTA